MSEMFGEISGIFRPVEDTSFIEDISEVVQQAGADLEPFAPEVIRLQHIAQSLQPKGREILKVDGIGTNKLRDVTAHSFAAPLAVKPTKVLLREHPHKRKSGKRVFDIAVAVKPSTRFNIERDNFLAIDGIEDRYLWRPMVQLGKIALNPGVRRDDLRRGIDATLSSRLVLTPGVVDAEFKLTQ